MESSGVKVTCPNCGAEININEILYHQLAEDIKKQFASQQAEDKKRLEQELSNLAAQKDEFEKRKQRENELFQERLTAKLAEEKNILEQQIKQKISGEQAEQFAVMQKELQEQSEKLKELNRNKAEIERLKREKEELKDSIMADAEKDHNLKLAEEREKIRKQEQEKSEMALRELQMKLDQQKQLTEEMKRKQEQGSMQLQGEVQELGIEEWLRNNFPYDEIAEVKKGQRGADCLQIVNTPAQQNCGTIYYESKRTKDFQPGWIEKFKNDLREQNANIGVLVTDTLPKGFERLGLLQGVWVCTYQEFKALCFVLRENIIQIANAVSSQENKGEKMHMLYDFLTSNEFRLQIEAIVEGFSQMQEDLMAEKRSIQGHWKKREKQIQKVLLNTNYMYNSIKGIAGSAVASIKQLELPQMEEDETEE